MRTELNQVDLSFIVDTTGSMGHFITAARQQMIDVLTALTDRSSLPIDMQIGLIEYRDHPPEDRSFVFRAHAFTPNLKAVQTTIDHLKPEGGGDACEAVFDGILAACDELEWRTHSQRLAVLIGDAPPHGVGGRGDGFRTGCPCGLNPDRVTSHVETSGIVLYAIGLTHDVTDSFTRLARFTGGEYFASAQGAAAIDTLKGVLLNDFDDLDLDRQVLDRCAARSDWTIDQISDTLSMPRGRISSSLSRLGRRGLL